MDEETNAKLAQLLHDHAKMAANYGIGSDEERDVAVAICKLFTEHCKGEVNACEG